MILQLAVLYVNDPLIDETYVSDPPDQVFNDLRMVKINSFRGYPNEIRLLKILLEKAVALELLILVSPAWDINETASTGMPVSASLEQLLLFPGTSSEARILFYEYGETRNWPQHIPSPSMCHTKPSFQLCKVLYLRTLKPIALIKSLV